MRAHSSDMVIVDSQELIAAKRCVTLLQQLVTLSGDINDFVSAGLVRLGIRRSDRKRLSLTLEKSKILEKIDPQTFVMFVKMIKGIYLQVDN